MGKHNSKEAFYARLRDLALDGTTTNNKPNRLGTLIDYVRDDNGIAYGIVKESHNYYIKKGSAKENPKIEDFTYIGGLANITNYQYRSISEADKNRNMLLQSINESLKYRLDGGSTKLIINEDAGDEIEKAEKKLPDLEKATAEKEAPMPVDEPDFSGEPMDDEMPPMGDEGGGGIPPMGDDMPDMGGEDTPPMGDEEMPDMDGDGDDEGADGEIDSDEPNLIMKDIEKYLGKATNLIRDTELEPVKVKSYINTYLSAFKDKLPEVDVEDRKTMADKILKVVNNDDIEDLGDTVEKENIEECGGFAQHLESRGFDNETIHECDNETLAEMISSYANSYNMGENDGSFNEVALFTNEEILNTLREEYGHDDYVDQLMEFVNQLTESTEEDRIAQINELSWSGIKGAMNKMGGDIKAGAQGMYDKAKGAVQRGVDNVRQYASDVKQSYYSAETDALVKKLEKFGEELKPLLQNIDAKAEKAGRQPINLQSMFQRMMYQIRQNQPISLSGINEDAIDPTYIETSPNINELEDIDNVDNQELDNQEMDIETPEPMDTDDVVDFPTPEPMMGAGDNNSLTVDVDGSSKTVNIQMSESEKRLRNYVNNRMDILTGKKKETMNESKKSNKMKKLDNLIESEYTIVLAEQENKKKEEQLRKYVREHLDVITGKKKASMNESKKSNKMKKLDNLIESEYTIVLAEQENKKKEEQLRKYVREHLDVITGKKKASMNESKKSDKMKKLDNLIESQYKLYSELTKK